MRRLPFVALVFALPACGGGGGGRGDGVGSTPPPPTSPNPPTTPTPPPTGSNSSLVAPLLSETFVNRNAQIALTADVAAETGTSTTTQRTLAMSYDASTNSYTLTANGRTLVFGPSDRRAPFPLPERRRKTLLRAQVGPVVRKATVAGFAPRLRLIFERNRSRIEIYDYKRRAMEVGVVRAF